MKKEKKKKKNDVINKSKLSITISLNCLVEIKWIQ